MKTISFPVNLLYVAVIFCAAGALSAEVTDVSGLVNAVNNGSANDTIILAAGTYELTGPLRPKNGMSIRGAGAGATIIMGAASWNPGTDGLPEGGMNKNAINRNAYLFDLGDNTFHITISDMTLRGPLLHGALYGNNCDYLEMYNLNIEDFIWSSIRTFGMAHAKIYDNVFMNAGGKVGSITGGALYLTWVVDSEFWNNLMYKTAGENFYGFKGRQGKRCRFHHNTVKVGFSLEFPFEQDEEVEIDHNVFWGAISIPKWGGGPVFANKHSFHIHHNWLKSSYALEWPRNCAIIENNLFEFDTDDDGGNLVSNFASHEAPGPTHFRNNLIKNPGRGVFWSQGSYDQFYFHNNHVITNTTATPRTEGLFGFPSSTDFSTIEIKDNIIECNGLSRPLVRNTASYGATIENNTLINVSDADAYSNPDTGAPRGPLAPLDFSCGVNGRYHVTDWIVSEAGNSQAYQVPDMVGYWPMDGNAKDVVGHHDGINFGNSGYAPGAVGQARVLDGVRDYVLVSGQNEWDPRNGASSLTVAAWCYRDYTSSGGRTLVTQRKGSEWNINDVTWSLNAAHWKTDFSDYNDQASTGAIPLGEWHHLAGVYDGENFQGILYIDGVEVARDTNFSLPGRRKNPIAIGALTNGNQPHRGMVDDVRIYKRALSAEEVAELTRFTGSMTFNFAPVVSVRTALNIGLDSPFQLHPSFKDDGKPWMENADVGIPDNPTPVGLSYEWTVVDTNAGDGFNPSRFVQFSDAAAADPCITIIQPGTYLLQLTVYDDRDGVSPQIEPGDAGKSRSALISVNAAGDAPPVILDIGMDVTDQLILSVSDRARLEATVYNDTDATYLWEVVDSDPVFAEHITLEPSANAEAADIVFDRDVLGPLLRLPNDQPHQLPVRLTVTDSQDRSDEMTATLAVRDPDCTIAVQEHGMASDFNGDCIVDLRDMQYLLAEWLSCYDPLSSKPGCENPYAPQVKGLMRR